MWVVCLVLLLFVIISALGVVFSSYKSRQLFSDVQQQYAQTLALDEQWGRLLLEQSTWSSHSRIEQLAKTKLSMMVPDPAAIIVVKE
ncbi:MAG: cell division protein FtsL [Spongiibacteraceae bacterium]|nr:cell division protein FtsL [Spongiibacteraceae bacterium]